jgi:hypothetical protein
MACRYKKNEDRHAWDAPLSVLQGGGPEVAYKQRTCSFCGAEQTLFDEKLMEALGTTKTRGAVRLAIPEPVYRINRRGFPVMY